MKSYHSCWVEISAKVFVSVDEMEQAMEKKFPKYAEQVELCNRDYEGLLTIYVLCTPEEVKETFQEIAQQKISDHFPTDEPMKLNEAIIDMTTFK